MSDLVDGFEEKLDADVTLVVDLDGTLCRTDTLHEMVLRLITVSPRNILKMPRWLANGRARFKELVADVVTVAPSELPLNEPVLEEIRSARAAGRRTALVSAADHRQVTRVAEDTGLFDEAFGTAEGHNLKGELKAKFLNERYGKGQYDYMGDSAADLPVWSNARVAITVRADPSLRDAAEKANSYVRHIDPPHGRKVAMLKSLRPHQWSKNLLLFLPLLASHDFTKVMPVFLGFVAFCLTASAVYIVNDLLDLTADRSHPRKRNRPFASGELTAPRGGLMASALLMSAILIGLVTDSIAFLLVLFAYLATTFLYSLWLKRNLLIDVITLAGLYTVRIIAGGVAGGIDISPWMLGFSMFIFLALAAVKRQAELTDLLISDRDSKGRAYTVDDLPVLRGIAISGSQASVLVLALYLSSEEVRSLYSFPSLLWLICPLLLYWTLRMVMKAHRGQMTDDPIVYAATDKISILIVLICAIIGITAALWPWFVPKI